MGEFDGREGGDGKTTTPDRLARAAGRLRREVRYASRRIHPRRSLFLALARLLPDFAFPSLRTALFRAAGFDISGKVALLGRVIVVGQGDVTERLTIGEGCIIAPGVTLGLDGPITLGRNVSISPNAVLYTATHALGFGSQRMSPVTTAKPLVIEDGAWIGMHSLILPGVTVGRGSVVSAGSVVTQDVPENTLVAGNPAAVQQKLPFGNR
jgi:maltose O-acetyltransferase